MANRAVGKLVIDDSTVSTLAIGRLQHTHSSPVGSSETIVGNQSLPVLTQAAVVDATTETIAGNQSLPVLTQAAVLHEVLVGVIEELMPSYEVSASGTVSESINAAQSLPVLTQAAVVDATTETIAGNQSLPVLTQAAVVDATTESITVNQSLPVLTQAAVLVADNETISAAQSLPVLTQQAYISGEMVPAFARLDWTTYDVLTRDTTAVRADGLVSGAMNLVEFGRVIGAWPVASVPTAGDDYGLHEVTAGGSEGVYMSTGTEIVAIVMFP